MITVDKSTTILSDQSTICVVNSWNGNLEQLNRETELIKSYFPKNASIDYIYYIEEKQRELSKEWNGTRITFVSNKDFNFLGRLKNKELMPIFNQNHDFLLTLFFSPNKGVKNILKLKNHSYSCGAEIESLPNFDFSFRMKKSDPEELVKQIKKYLIS